MASTINDILIRISGVEEDAERALEEITAELLAFGQITSTANANLDIGEAMSRLTELEYALAVVDGYDVSPEVHADTQEAMAQMQVLMARLRYLGAKGVEIDIDVQRDISAQILQFARAVQSIQRAAAVAAPDTKSFLDRIKDTAVNLGPFTTQLRVAGPLLLAFSSIISSIVGGLGGLVASLAQAAAGFGALAVAAGGALVPVLALGIGAFQRLQNATQAADELKTATEQLHQASQQVVDAERALSEAQQRQRQASKDLTEARREAAIQARTEYQSAINDFRDAEDALAQAEFSQQQAVEGLAQAREDAARAIIDQRLAAQGAAISEKQALLNLQRARNALREAEAAGVKGMKLKQLRLDLARAELEVRSSREDNQRSQEDLSEAEAEGVEGSDAVVQAKQNLIVANQDLADSNRELVRSQAQLIRLQRQQKGPADQVVAARRQLAEADRAAADAERRLHEQQVALNQAQRQRNQLLEKSAAIQKGTAGRGLLDAAKEFSRAFQAATAKGADAIFRGVSDALNDITPMLRDLSDDFRKLGGAIGDAFAEVGEEFSSPRWQHFFEQMIRLARKLTPDVADAFIAIARIFRNIASAAGPALRGIIDSLVGGLESLAKSSGGRKELRDDIEGLVDQFRSWMNLIFQLARVFINFTSAGADEGKSLVDVLAGGAKSLADWLGSAEGMEAISDFIADSIPGFLAIVELVGKFIVLFLRLGQILSPLINPLLDAMTMLLDIIGFVIDAFNSLPGPIKDIAAFAALFLLPWTKVRMVIAIIAGLFGPLGDAVKGIAGLIANAFSHPIQTIKNLVGWIKDRLIGAFNTLKGIVSSVAGFFARLASGAVSLLIDALRGLWEWAGKIISKFGFVKDVFNRVKGVLVAIWNWIKEKWGQLWHLLTQPFRAAAQWIRDRWNDIIAFFSGIKDKIGNALLGLVDIITGPFEDAFNFIKDKFNGLVDTVKDAVDFVVPGEQFADGELESLGTGAADAAGAAADALGGVGGGGKNKPRDKAATAGKTIADTLAAAAAEGAGKAADELRRRTGPRRRGAHHPKIAPLSNDKAGNVNNFNMPITVPGGGSPDPQATVAAMTRRLRSKGLSIQ